MNLLFIPFFLIAIVIIFLFSLKDFIFCNFELREVESNLLKISFLESFLADKSFLNCSFTEINFSSYRVKIANESKGYCFPIAYCNFSNVKFICISDKNGGN